MKKIMIAAAVAAIGFGAFADCTEKPKEKDSAWVYAWKFTGKTTVGQKTKVAASLCKDGGDADCTIRIPGSLKIQGYIYYCNPACEDYKDARGEELEVFWMKKPYKTYLYGGAAVEVANIIGKKKKQFEEAGIATFDDPVTLGRYELAYAGLGKYKKGRVSSVKGNFAGTLDQPYYVPKSGKCIPAGYWDCDLNLVCDGGTTVAYGKWSAKFKKSAAKKYAKNGKAAKLPKFVTKKWPNAE